MNTITRRLDLLVAIELSLFATLAASLIFAFAAPLEGMVQVWQVSPMYSYGFTVPFVSAYLLWARADDLRAAAMKPAHLAGGLVLLAACGMLVAGTAGSIQAFQQLGFLVAIVGMVLVMFGFRVLAIAAPAIAYLSLMIPIWDGLTESLHLPFQLRSAALAVWLLRLVGVPAHLNGTYVALPGLTLEVARACSGVNYLVAVLALGLPLSYLYLSSMWRRVALVMAATVVAALSNGLRVALIGVLAYLNIGSPLHGPFHVLHGLFVAGIGYLVLFGGLHLLGDNASNKPIRAHAVEPSVRWRLPRVELIAVLAVFVALGSGMLAQTPKPVPPAAGLDQFPDHLAQWQADAVAGRLTAPDWWPGADAELHRRYRHEETGQAVDVFIAYFAAQTQGRELGGYRAGELHRQSMPLTVRSDAAVFEANRVVKTDSSPEMLFWYEVGRTQTTVLGAKLQTVWNSVVYGRSNGAAVMLRFVSEPGAASPTDAQIQPLAAAVHAAFQQLVEGNSDVNINARR